MFFFVALPLALLDLLAIVFKPEALDRVTHVHEHARPRAVLVDVAFRACK